MSAAFTRILPIGTKMHKLLFGIKLLPSSGEWFYVNKGAAWFRRVVCLEHLYANGRSCCKFFWCYSLLYL